MANRKWSPIIAEAARIAASFVTAVTLRQLHYRLVVANFGGYDNTQYCYSRLSELTAEARRDGRFPALSDTTRRVARPLCFAGPTEALRWLSEIYRRDRTEGQRFQVWVLFEKATLSAQIEDWTEDYGIPTAALRGYSSESLEREVFDAMTKDGRPAVVFYIGDLDPEGEDIERNFQAQAARLGIRFQQWDRLGVTLAQARRLTMNFNPGKTTSSRAAGFIAKYGRLFQIEAEAIDPDVLRQLVLNAVTDPALFDQAVWVESQNQEIQDKTTF